MGFFDWKPKKQEPEKVYAITSTTTICGTFYVDKRGNNVCCAMDSAQSNGKTYDNVYANLQELKRKYPERNFSMEEI